MQIKEIITRFNIKFKEQKITFKGRNSMDQIYPRYNVKHSCPFSIKNKLQNVLGAEFIIKQVLDIHLHYLF